jgi:hypothetical protein
MRIFSSSGKECNFISHDDERRHDGRSVRQKYLVQQVLFVRQVHVDGMKEVLHAI